MSITLGIDEGGAERARQAAPAMGKSLNQAVRDYLEQLAGRAQLESEIAAFPRIDGADAGPLGRLEVQPRRIAVRRVASSTPTSSSLLTRPTLQTSRPARHC